MEEVRASSPGDVVKVCRGAGCERERRKDPDESGGGAAVDCLGRVWTGHERGKQEFGFGYVHLKTPVRHPRVMLKRQP